MRPHETAALAEVRHHLFQRLELERVVALELLRSLEQLFLKTVQLVAQARRDPGHRHAHFLPRQPVDHLDLARVCVAPSDVQAQRDAFQLPVRVLVAGSLVAPVDAVADPRCLELARPAVDETFDLGAAGVIAKDRYHNNLHWRHLGWDEKT